MSNSPRVSTPQALTVGGSTPVTITGGTDSRILLTFVGGDNSGSITVTAKVWKGDKFETVTDGTIALNARKYVYIPDIPIEAVNIAYSGSAAALNVVVSAFDNR